MITETRPTPVRQPVAARHLLAGVSCLAALAATYLLAVWTPGGQALDNWSLGPLRGVDGTSWSLDLLHLLGAPSTLLGAAVLILLVGFVGRRWWAGVAGLGLVVTAVVVSKVLKEVLVRPDLENFGTTHNSFPSGHVTVAAAVVFAVLLALPAAVRWWAAVPGAGLVLAVTAATVDAGWHRVSDGIGGTLVAAAVYCFMSAASRAFTTTASIAGRRVDA